MTTKGYIELKYRNKKGKECSLWLDKRDIIRIWVVPDKEWVQVVFSSHEKLFCGVVIPSKITVLNKIEDLMKEINE